MAIGKPTVNSILIIFHCESNTGYAIERLESVFFEMALELMENDVSRVHFGYPGMGRGPSKPLPSSFSQYVIVDCADDSRSNAERVTSYIRKHRIDTIFAFDHPVSFPLYKHLRAAGVQTFVSYCGAPMSSVFGPIKLFVKRLEVRLRRHGPDHYIFESEGMARTATMGRGIEAARTSVISLGVDTSLYFPHASDSEYTHEQFSIPKGRKIFVFSGHMEPRKGVHVIMRAAKVLREERARDDWHVLLLGDIEHDRSRLEGELGTGPARRHVTFAGYRHDLPRIHRGCYAGIIASTGWDSLTMSAIELQSSGVPLLVSNLHGLNEAIVDGQTGFLFPVGDHYALADKMMHLIDNPELRDHLSGNARLRVERQFSRQAQVARLVSLVRQLSRKHAPHY